MMGDLVVDERPAEAAGGGPAAGREVAEGGSRAGEEQPPAGAARADSGGGEWGGGGRRHRCRSIPKSARQADALRSVSGLALEERLRRASRLALYASLLLVGAATPGLIRVLDRPLPML